MRSSATTARRRTTADGIIVGAACGLGLAVVELSFLSWRTSVAWQVATAIAALDVGLLAALGLIIGCLRRALGVGFVVSAATLAAVTYPAVAGVLMRLGFTYNAMNWEWLPMITVGGALLMAIAVGLGGATLWRSWILREMPTSGHWEPWALSCLACVAGIELATVANSAYLRPLLSAKSALGNALLFFVTLAAVRFLLVVRRNKPAGMTFTAALAGAAIVRLSAGLAGGAAQPAQMPPRLDRPSVILITLDTVRADHLSAYGYAQQTSPNLEAFAAEAELYEHAISPSTWTLPAHTSLFTGMSLWQHGVRDRARTRSASHAELVLLDPHIPTIAEILARDGYATAAFVANCWYLGADMGLARGFASYAASPRTVAIVRPAFGALISTLMPDRYAAFIRPFRAAHEINAAAIRWIDETAHEPFFMFLNYMEAHWPYEAPPPYRDRFPGSLHVRGDHRVPWDWYQRLVAKVHHLGSHVSAEERRHLETSYDAALAYLDAQLGELFDALRRRGLYERALIIVTSDHGELFGEHALIGHGQDPYEGVTRVPLLIRYPMGGTARRISQPVSTREIFRIVLERAGLASPTESTTAAPIISEVYTLPPRGPDPLQSRIRRAIYEGSLKVIESPNGDAELYDVFADPAEQIGLSARLPDKQSALSAKLHAWLQAEPEAGTPRAVRELDPATLEALRALGYLH